MKQTHKIIFAITLIFIGAWSAIRFVSSKGLPPAWVHALEPGLDSLDSPSSSELAKPHANLSALIGSQRKQQEALDSLSNEVKELEGHVIETEDQVRAAQQRQDPSAVAQMMQAQAGAQQEEIKRYKELVDELNKEKREESNKKTKPMPIIITGFLGLAALVVLMSRKYDAETTKWAIGILGVVAGFWLGGA
jgi:TolA-binding protein